MTQGGARGASDGSRGASDVGPRLDVSGRTSPVAGEHRAFRIGLTGPIGCGKSTVAAWLADRPGVVAIDADVVAREVLDPGTPAVEAVYARFGAALRQADGALDRAALGRIVFGDADALRELESIVHPAVRPRILAAMADADRAGAVAVVVEAIKLVEGGLAGLCDEVWLITCPPTVQRDRLRGRGASPADADRRIAAQDGLVARIADAATRTIDTAGDPATTRAVVERTFDAALERWRARVIGGDGGQTGSMPATG